MTDEKQIKIDSLMNRIAFSVDARQFQEARQLVETLVEFAPDFGPGWLVAAQIANQMRQRDETIAFLDKACEVSSDDPEILASASQHYSRLDAFQKSRASAEKVMSSGTNDARFYEWCGGAFNACGDYEASQHAYERSLELNPITPGYYYNLAVVERFLGKIDLAEKHIEGALERKPHYGRAHYELANLRRQTPETAHIDRLRGILEDPTLAPDDKLSISYALGKELNDLGDYENAFRAFSEGARAHERAPQYTVSDEVKVIDQLIAEHTADVIAQLPKSDVQESPIFVLGLPRTGSTLVERILDSHGEVVSKGELNSFRQIAGSLMYRLPNINRRDDVARAYLEIDLVDVGRRYLAAAEEHAPDGSRFVDKFPLNSLLVGMIVSALPSAKIIYLDRNPMDSAIAIFTTLFNNFYHWSYDLGEISIFIEAHRRLMDHWRREFPDRILTVSYEELVSNQEAVTRDMLEFCDLPWDDACLRFHENKSAATTASSTQVRNPVHTSSIGRWKNYEPYIGNALDSLKELPSASD